MIKLSALRLSAAMVLGLAACATVAPESASADNPTGKSCKNTEPVVVTGNFPVYSYWCKTADTNANTSKPIQLDVYVGNSREVMFFYNCTVPPLPPDVHSILCP
jgi:hypothetical protein